MTDQQVAEVCTLAKQLRVTVHIRGTDQRPVIEVRDKRSCKIVGGIEPKQRMARLDPGNPSRQLPPKDDAFR